MYRTHRPGAAILAAAGAAALVLVLVLAAPATAFASSGHAAPRPAKAPRGHHNLALQQVNLASDVPGLAGLSDPDLKNPWGAALTPTSPLWVANQGTDSSTVYSLAPGASTVTKSSAVRVTLPGSVAGPSGLVANPGSGFAANFVQGTVDVFDSAFHQVKLASWQFRDRRLPQGFVPFNAQALGGTVFVTYDKPDPTTHREGVGAGIGVVDEYSTSGRLLARVAAGGALNAPWGLTIAPSSWGRAAGSLLIGNFGDGRINIFARQGHGFASHATGQVIDQGTGKPFAEPGLWQLQPGTSTTGGTGAIWFTAGINDEADGLLGILRK